MRQKLYICFELSLAALGEAKDLCASSVQEGGAQDTFKGLGSLHKENVSPKPGEDTCCMRPNAFLVINSNDHMQFMHALDLQSFGQHVILLWFLLRMHSVVQRVLYSVPHILHHRNSVHVLCNINQQSYMVTGFLVMQEQCKESANMHKQQAVSHWRCRS